MKFELKRLEEYTDDAIIAELRRVAALNPDKPLLAIDFDKAGRVARTTVTRRFGSWLNALKVAGLYNQSTDVMVVKGANPSRRMSNDDLLNALRDLSKRLGKATLTNRDINKHLNFSDETLRRRWGTTHSAYMSAGLITAKLGKRYNDEECFVNMLNLWTHYGRQPLQREFNIPPSDVGSKAYLRRFGTWNKAVAAFVERVNSEGALPDVSQPRQEAATTLEKVTKPATAKPRELVREIPQGLRYQILHRDRFKCVLCGDHPAKNPKTNLHVDHIVPWSLGGLTNEENLRTLCAACNIGRGNRFTD